MHRQQKPATISEDDSRMVALHSHSHTSWQSPDSKDAYGVAPTLDTSYQHSQGPPGNLDAYANLAPSIYPWTFTAALQPLEFDTSSPSVGDSTLHTTDSNEDEIGTLEPISYFTDAVINSFIAPQSASESLVPISWQPEVDLSQPPIEQNTESSEILSNAHGSIVPLKWQTELETDQSLPEEKTDLSKVVSNTSSSSSSQRVAKRRPSSNVTTKSSTQSTGIAKTKQRKPVEPSFRACWRCKKYRKPCDHNTVCNGCLMTSGFRIWPSTIGCKRGSLHEFAYLIVPVTTPEALKQLKFEYVKPFSWRLAPLASQQEIAPVSTNTGGDVWTRIINRMQTTYIHGPGVLELLEIGARFQRRQLKPNAALREAAISLHLVMELYHSLVSTTAPETFDLNIDIEKRFLDVRKAIMQTMDRYVHICLTGRLKAWPPILISCSMFVIAYIYLADAVAALPWLVRTHGWTDVQGMVIDLRKGLYTIAKDLLSALAKGVKMLDMECWVYEDDPKSGEHGTRRNGQGMRMMDEDDSAFDAMADLVEWRGKFLNLLNGDIWMSTNPFDVDLLPIMSLARLFNVSENLPRKGSEGGDQAI